MEKEKKKFYKNWWFVIAAIILYTIIVIVITTQVCKTREIVQANVNVSKSKDEEVKTTEGKVETEKKKQNITIGEIIQEKDWEVKIKETGFKQDIVPSNPNSYYTHYQVKDTNNTYFYLTIEAKNISTLGLRADNVAKAKVKYNDKYEYTTFSTIEETGGGTFTYTNITDISPLTTRTLYYLVELPKKISEETDTSVKAEITINDNTYELNVR